jgi:hypothetical protein
MEFAVGIAERSFAVALKTKRRLNNSDTPRKNDRHFTRQKSNSTCYFTLVPNGVLFPSRISVHFYFF